MEEVTVSPTCRSCHLLRGHSEHRSNGWRAEEVLRSAVQVRWITVEGYCMHFFLKFSLERDDKLMDLADRKDDANVKMGVTG